ncbi:Eukaryotic translation initiation factor 4 gamma 1 [Clonorchis sinensis]|uniref:Eukaryotic translation initiation factor 4 gamma 1 n=1 Tax=Clonorchis sinensis TaxID=79923 RepID=A0A8T1MVT9_CLOSI|nr:Eukaryotic translation initiation factor 4 gamma 1 [Clonorchis sinensis]
MSEQPPLYQQNTLNAAAGSRINDPHMMSVPYYVYLKTPTPFAPVECPRTQPTAPRLDAMSFTTGAAVPIHNYYQCMMRPPEQVNYLYRMQQMPVLCQSVLRPYLDPPIPNQMTNSVDYGPLGFSPYQTMYPPAAHTSQPLQTSAPIQRPITPAASVATPPRFTKSRERCPLQVKDPTTGANVDLSQTEPRDSQLTPNEEPPRATTPETVTPNDTSVNEGTHDPVGGPSEVVQIPPELVQGEESVITDVHGEQKRHEQQEPPRQYSEVGEQVLENGSSVEPPMSKKVIDDFIEAESGEETDDSDAEDAAYRRIYPREFLLTCKDSPVARVPLQELATYFADYSRPRKGHRNTSRAAPQRIIRLPTGITVKRVEGAFVPSHLRKKEGAETDHQKVLSRELNVILNRVSDGNLPETISDIKNLNISSSEDLQLLAKLVFQKSIRQPKYSKVFSTLCRELKGFEVSGSEPFEGLILCQARELFHTPLETLISELNAAIDAKIAAAKDEAVKRVLEDGRETNIVKKTEAYYGNITFLAELFLCRLVTPRIMTKCLSDLRDSTAPEALNSMLILLRTCGRELEQQSKSVVESCFSRLNGYLKSNKLPTHRVFKIQELIDIRDRGWKEIDHAHAPPDAPTKRPDEKVRWPYGQPPVEPKRKLAQSVDALTPSSLAVKQQSLDSRKLGPAHDNWVHGSGLLSRNPAEDKEGTSRHTSHSSAFRQPGVSFAQTVRPKEDYESVLKRNLGCARTVLTMLKANEDSMYAVFEDCKPDERSALLHGVLEQLMDEKSQTRNAAGIMCLQLLNRGLLSNNDIFLAFDRYLPNCTGDWLEDYPHGWRYLAEILQHLIQKDQDNFILLLSVLKILKSEGRGASIFAHCLALSASRLGPDCVATKFHAQRLEWSRLGVPAADVENFVKRHSVEFTLSPHPLEIKLKELTDLAASPSTSLEQFTTLFKSLCRPELPGGFVRSCARALISKSKGLSRQQIDNRVTGLGILVDHNPDRELQVLQALHECSNSGTPTEIWQKSLLDKKVISTDALDCWTKSSNPKESVSGHIPIRNK